jgi:hypothetical protein
MANIVRDQTLSGFDGNSSLVNPPFPGLSGEALEFGVGLEVRPDAKAYKFTGNLPLSGVNYSKNVTQAGIPISIGKLGSIFTPGVDVVAGRAYFAAAAGEISDAATAQDTKGAFLGRATIGLGNTIVATGLEIIVIGKMT